MSEFEDLRKEFDAQPTPSEDRLTEIAAVVREQSDQLRSVLDTRDRTEFVACVFVAVAFTAGATFFSNAITWTGAVILIVGCAEIAVTLLIARRPADPKFMSLSLDEFLGHEIMMIERQIGLLRSVMWWYIAPIYVGAVVFVGGLTPWILFAVVFAAGYFFICFRIWQANQTARQENLEPLRERLEAARAMIANPDLPIDHPALLRDLSVDSFLSSPPISEDADAPEPTPTPAELLHGVGRFVDAVLVLVFMFWGGCLAGGMIDGLIAGKPLGDTIDGPWTVIVSIIAACYSLWTKPINVSILWGRVRGKD